MSKMRKLLAAVLVASMLLGSNGITYAAEATGADDTVSAVEVVEEAAEKESNQAADAELPDEREEAAAPDVSSEKSGDEEALAEEIAADTSEDEDASAEESADEASEEESADEASEEESADEASADESTDDASAEESVDEASADESTDDASAEESDEAASTEETSEAAPAEEESEAAPAEATEEAAAQATTQETAQEVFAAGELVYHGSGYDVTMAYDEKAEIPADAQLKVREIKKGTSEYDAYLSGAQAASDKGVAEARFFDITIWAKDKEIQPRSAVRVNISYKKAIDVADEGEVKAMHFEDGTEDPDILDTDTNGGSKVDEIAFDAESFSVYGVIYTVDFTYDGYTFSMPGEGSILLSELADELGLYEKDLDKAFSVDNVSDVTFTDYDLIKIEKQADGDWLLTSLASFTSEETLTIAMVDGTKFVVVVTDPPEETGGTQTSSDLSNFLTSVLITGATQNSEGRYEVEQGKEYTLIANFLENADYQFQNDADLTYQMPEGIKVLNEQRGPLKINIVYKGKTYEVDASYVLTTDGKLTIRFDESDPEYPKLVSSTNVGFRFTYRAEFDGNATEIHFSDEVERDIVFNEPEPGQAFANKTAVYDESTGTFNYTIKVNATGDVTNVNVKDVITGDALIFNNDVRVSGNSSDYTDNGAANGFDYTFASMREGDEITITYSAKVNFAKDTDKDGKINADQTKNTVTVEPEDGEPHKSDYSHEIVFNTAKKSEKGTEEGTTENGDKIIGWTINYNPLALASAAGYTITDTIAAGSAEYMKYYGDGITVKRYDHDNNFVDSYQVPYASMTSHSDSSWTYTIPDDHTEPYRYVITYQTVVDMEKVDGAGSAVHLENTANGSQGTVDVTPGNQVGITKQVVQSSTQEISWVSEIHIPDGGLDVAVITDTLPTIWSTNIGKSQGYSLYDLLKGDVVITGLIGDESYNLDTSSEDKVIITFFKDKNKITPGLTGVEGGHTITVRLTTTVNQEWLEAGYNYPTSYQSYHENKIDINGTTATAGVRFLEEDMVKTASVLGNGVFKYTIKLSNVSESPIIIDDVFDTSLLEVDLSKESADWNKEVFYITGGSDVDHIYSGEKSEKVNYSETESGIRITANTVPMQEDGQYYPAYMITYFLKLKDGVNLEQLAIANGGKHELTNTANWNGHESSYTYETVYDYLDKKLLNAGELGGTNREARYQITFNSSKAVLNGGEPMEMTDTLSANLSVDYSSITIVTDPQGVSVPYSFKGGDEGTTIATYTVPDATAVTITYRASVAGNGTQKIVNKVKVKNDEETEENSSDYGSAGEGEGAIAAFKIVKVDGYDANKKLSGVKFKLYPGRSGIYFDDDNTVSELFYTTDENGEIIIDGDATIDDGDPTTEDKKIKIFFNQLYYLQEVEGPENYEKIAFPYNITLTNDMSLVDYGSYIYYYSDTMQIKNWPLEGVIIEKQVESTEAADLERRYNFKISILDENGEVDTSISEKIGDDDFVDGVTYFDLKTGEQKMFWGFAKGTRYKVEEIDADGFATTVTYSVYDEDGNVTKVKTETTSEHTGELTQEDETIVFTNKKTSNGSLKLKKLVTVNGEATTGTLADGDYTFTIEGPSSAAPADQVTKTVVIKVTGGVAVSATVDGASATLDADKYVEVADLAPGEYTITETTPTNGTSLVGDNNKKVTVVAGESGEDVSEDAKADFTNNIDLGSLKIKKNVTVNGAATTGTEADGTYTFNIIGPNSYKKEVTVAIENGNSKEVQVDDLVPGTYTVSEDTSKLPAGMQLVTDNGLEIVVTAGETAEVPTAEFTNNKPGTPTFEKKIKDTNDTTGETSGWQDSADYDIGDEIPFKLTATLANDVSSYRSYSIVFEDVMENTLTFKGVSKVILTKNNGTTQDITLDSVFSPTSGGQRFTVSTGWGRNYNAERMPISELLNGATVDVYFTAVLNANAKLGNEGNVNSARLRYSNNPNNVDSFDKTPWDYVIAFTYKLDINKVDKDGEALTGAEFKLEKKIKDSDPVEVELTKAGHVFTGKGLDDGTYVLTETKAPQGYKPIDPITFIVTAEHGITWDYNSDGNEPAFGGEGRTDILTELTGESKSGNLEFTTPQTVAGLVGTVKNHKLGSLKLTKIVTVDGKTTTGTEADGSYTFTIVGPAGAEEPASKTVVITIENGKIKSATVGGEDAAPGEDGYVEVTGLEAGDYTIAETAPTKAGVKLVSAQGGKSVSDKIVTVTVADDLTGDDVPPVATASFTNDYSASGTAELEAIKAVSGAAWPSGAKATFTVTATDGTPMPEKTSETLTEAGTADFGTIHYTLAHAGKTYTYTITENGSWGAGWTSNRTITATVEVTDNGNGTLATNVTYTPEDKTITNTYTTEGKVEIQVTKAVNGALWPEGVTATFALEAVTAGAPMPETTSVPLTAAGIADFGEITYGKSDAGKTYEYKITETGTGFGDGWRADPEEITVTVKVGDDKGDGTLKPSTVTYDPENGTITNIYETDGSITFSGKKTLENRKLKKDEFSFELYDLDSGSEEPIQTVTNAEDGSYSFEAISYTGADLNTEDGHYIETTKRYKVVEKDGGKKIDGVTYDGTAYEITVTLTDDGKGNIEAVAVPKEDTYNFKNTYEAEGNITFSGTKTLENRKLEEGKFSFELYEVDGENETLKETVSNAADGSYSFSEIKYTGDDLGKDTEGNYNKTATKTYKVVEKDGGKKIDGVTYDGTAYEITVTLTDDGKGNIEAVAVPKEDTYNFTNTYSAEGSVVIEAGKFLEGRPLEKDQFKFELVETLADGTEKTVETVGNSNDGSITFSAIEYTQDDMDKDADGNLADTVKKYTIKEQKEDAAGYTYSEEVYTVNVTLHDDGKGKIETTKDKKPEDLVFANTYSAKGEIVIEAGKKLVGKDKLEEGQFSFELRDAEGKVLQTKSNKADGSVTFDAIGYTQDDIYEKDEKTGEYSGADTKSFTYTINEVIPEGAKDNGDGTYDLDGYTYDGTVYTVKVTATDNGDGTIAAKIDGAEDSKPVFTNAYKADGTLKLDAEKTFKNGTLKGNDFTFELLDADGNVLQSKKNDAAGKVSFDLITYEMADTARSPITYTVKESAGSRTDVKYDETIYTITVTLKDNGKGKLDVTKVIDNGGKLKFVNEQRSAETSITLGGVKTLEGQELKSGMFSFVLKDQSGKWVGSASNDANGNFTFGKITYKLADLKGERKKVYTYKIAEVKGSKSGIIYDTRVYTVTVTVTDNGDGTMTAKADTARSDVRFVNKTETKKPKKKDSTRTGDEAPLGVLFGGLGIGVVGLAVLIEDRRRKNKKG